MSSHDGSDRPNRPRRSQQTRRTSAPYRDQANDTWEVDSADIDRYLSGRPSRGQENHAPSPERRGPRSDTASQLNRLQDAVDSPPPRRQRRSPSAGRQQFIDPEPEELDDWYEDPVDMGYDVGDEGDLVYDDEYDAPPEPRPRRRQSQARQRPARSNRPQSRQTQRQPSRQPVYDDGFDEELYADDPYLPYADEEDWVEPPPRRAARPRPQARLNKPNLPRFSMPTSISQAEIANDIPALAMFGSAVLSAAVMSIVVSNRMDMLPEIIPTHVSASGVPENLAGRSAIWSIPILSIAISLMNFGAGWFIAKIDMFAARFLVGAALLVQLVAWIAVIEYLW